MKYLIDTCGLVWFLANDRKRMPSSVMDKVEDDTNDVYVSAASIWEIAIKSSLGRLVLHREFSRANLIDRGFEVLDIRFSHAMGVRELPFAHRDPFDRLMISQCRQDGLTAITPDSPWRDQRYGIEVVWD